MNQATADFTPAGSQPPPTTETQEAAPQAPAGNQNPDELELEGIPPELMTDLPVDQSAPTGEAAPESISGQSQQPLQATAPVQDPAVPQAIPVNAQPAPVPPQFQQPQTQVVPAQANAPLPGLPINGQPVAPPVPAPQPTQVPQSVPHAGFQANYVAPPAAVPSSPIPALPPLANNYRLSAAGNPLKQLSLSLMRSNPALMPAEAQAKAEEQLGAKPSTEETELKTRITAKEVEADQAAEDIEPQKSRKLDREASSLKEELNEKKQAREKQAEGREHFENEVAASTEAVGAQYPEAFVEGSPMNTQMKAVESAFRTQYGDDRVDQDPRIMEMIAQIANQQLLATGQPGAPLQPVPALQQAVPQQPAPGYQQGYSQQPVAVPSPVQPAAQPGLPGHPAQFPQPAFTQQSTAPPLAPGSQGRAAPGDPSGMLDKINSVSNLEELDSLVESLGANI